MILAFVLSSFLLLIASACCSSLSPEAWNLTNSKVSTVLAMEDEVRALVIYHLGPLHEEVNSIEIMTNNVKMFVGSIGNADDKLTAKDFYIFNVIGESHPLKHLIPQTLPNVDLFEWNTTSSDLATHLQTLQLLGTLITRKFEAILFVNHGVRGPFVRRRNGQWIEQFLQPLRRNNVGMVGPTLSCEVAPHVQTHMFALRASLIPYVQAKMKEKLEAKYKTWVDLIASLEVGLTGIIMSAGYNVTSFLHQSRGQTHFTACLKYDGPQNLVDKNPTSWCGLSPKTLVFVKWGGEAMRNPGYLCNTMVSQMDDALEQTARTEPQLQLAVPEVRRGGPMSNVFKMYAQEAWIDRRPVLLYPAVGAMALTKMQELKSEPKVCFLVRVIFPRLAHLHYENPQTNLINKEIKLLITSLQRQRNPHWNAMFYSIDKRLSPSFFEKIQSVTKDARVEFTDLGVEKDVAEYSVTDKILLRALQRPECQWISVTTSDNAYGSEVVQNVLSHRGGEPLLIAALDSKRYLNRKSVPPHVPLLATFPIKNGSVSRGKNFLAKDPEDEALGCAFLSRLASSGFTNLVNMPLSSHQLNLVAVFLHRDKLKEESVLFGHFANRATHPCYDSPANSTDPPGHLCLNAEGTHLLEHLIQRRHWALAQLPADGLRSVVFHGNSPTLCIGADHIWLDHQDPLLQRCITAMDAFRMTEKSNLLATYDFTHLWEGQGPVIGSCLRMRKTKSVIKVKPQKSTVAKFAEYFMSFIS